MGSFFELGIMGFSLGENKAIILFIVRIFRLLKAYLVNLLAEFNDHFDKSEGEPYNPPIIIKFIL